MTSGVLPTVPFGSTDLRVTRLCQGTAFRTLEREAGDRQAEAVLRHCLDAGVRFFDSSNAYGWGGSERLLGQALRGRRDEVVICTKVSPSTPPPADGTPGTARAFTDTWLSEQLDGSRGRLDTDVIDLYLLHSPDGVTPMADLCERMQRLLDSGRIRHWGVSNHSAAQVEQLLRSAAISGATPPVGVEDYYSVAGGARTEEGGSRVRLLEREMFPVLRRAGMGLLAFSPMDRGDLAPGHVGMESGSPLAPLIEALDEVADELQCSRASVCVAWVLSHGEVTSVLGGAESGAHVDELVAGTRLELPGELADRLTAASETYSRRLES
jgi:aryl-alcohol dehydrogenase-like predicted oxidoreductase